MNVAPHGFTLDGSIGEGFMGFFLPLHRRFTADAQRLTRERAASLARAAAGEPPSALPPSDARDRAWQIELPPWCRNQCTQLVGPADDEAACETLLQSGAPGIVLDLEDSMVNTWEHLMRGHHNVLTSLYAGSGAVVWTRVRGLGLAQAGVVAHVPVSAPLFDLAMLVFRCDYSRMTHPLCISIPKSESASEALWWSDVFAALIDAKGWPSDSIKAIAVVESVPLAFQMEEFLFNLREYAAGLSFGHRGYLASLAHYNLSNPASLMPDRDKIPLDASFMQKVRELLAETTDRHGALAVLEPRTRNEATALRDPASVCGVAASVTLEGTHAAVRTAIRYRNGVLEGRGASLLDGCFEDLSSDRLCRLMIAQRMRFPGDYTPPSLAGAFDAELARLSKEAADVTPATIDRYKRARDISETLIRTESFDPT